MGVPDVKCAPIAAAASTINGVDLGIGILGVIGVVIAGVLAGAAAIGVAALTPASLAIWAVALIASCLFAINLINKALDVLFHYKLACIDGEQCALGQVKKIELNPDGDTTFNLKLSPIIDGVTTLADFKASPQGPLIFSDPGSASRGWIFRPENGAGVLSDVQPIPLLHCEIEGSYLNDWLTGLLALLWSLVAVATAAIVLAATELIPVVGWIIWAIVALLALFATLLGIHMANDASSQGSSAPDVPVGQKNPSPDGPLIVDAMNRKVAVGDFIVLRGLHVLDCGHAEDSKAPNGTWCEIHPVRFIAKIDQRIYDDVTAGQSQTPPNHDLLDLYCNALQKYAGARVTGVTAASLQAPLEHPRIG